MASRERREYSRVEVSWPVGMLTSEGLIEGEVKNISFDGAGIQCKEAPKIDESLDIRQQYLKDPAENFKYYHAYLEGHWKRIRKELGMDGKKK